jgi:hypothetical protein
MSTEAAIQKGKGIVSNPAFFMIFALCAALIGAGIATVIFSWLDYCGAAEECPGGAQPGALQGIRFVAIILVVVIAALFATAWFTGMKENLFIGLICVLGLLSGILTIILVWYMWTIDPQGNFYDGMKPIYGIAIAVLFAALPPVVLTLERYGILPLFVAIFAGVFGVLSLVIFVMVVFSSGDTGAAGGH